MQVVERLDRQQKELNFLKDYPSLPPLGSAKVEISMTEKPTEKPLICSAAITNVEWLPTNGPTSPEKPQQILRGSQQVRLAGPIPKERLGPKTRPDVGSPKIPQQPILIAKRGCQVVHKTPNCYHVDALHSLAVDMLPVVKLCYYDESVDCNESTPPTLLSNKPCSATQLLDYTISTRWRSTCPTVDPVSIVFKDNFNSQFETKKRLLLFVFQSWFWFKN